MLLGFYQVRREGWNLSLLSVPARSGISPVRIQMDRATPSHPCERCIDWP